MGRLHLPFLNNTAVYRPGGADALGGQRRAHQAVPVTTILPRTADITAPGGASAPSVRQARRDWFLIEIYGLRT